MEQDWIRTEGDLISAALALGARAVPGWSAKEEGLAQAAPALAESRATELQRKIENGRDPLGDAFCRIRSAEVRRTMGATYTPDVIVSAMTRWAKAQKTEPARIVDAGAGSARFLMSAARMFKGAELVAIEVDALAAMIARANLATSGLAQRASVIVRDYRNLTLPRIAGPTLYVGNPPYVRHHQIDAASKEWLTSTAKRLGHDASQLAGLHVYFFLATATKATTGDFGVFITAAEWLDVNYGRLVRSLFLNQLGGQSLTVIEPTVKPFADAATTAAITCFSIGSRPQSIKVSRVADTKELGNLLSGQPIHRGRLESAARWSHLTRKQRSIPEGHVELGELCRVHRGQVTGANRVWIAGAHSVDLPKSVLFPTVTRARELFQADGKLSFDAHLRDVIDIPADLDELSESERRPVMRFLKFAKSAGADKGYIATARKAWWSVGLRAPAPILATYMARRPPAFVRNLADARHLNIAHGLYPREAFGSLLLDQLAKYLSKAVCVTDGRTYAGGLTKFEPREMERLVVPSPELLKAATV